MDLTSLIMGLVLLALFVLPFVLVSRSNSKKKNHLLSRLKELALQNNSSIAKYDSCNNLMIGSDEKTTTIFFISETDENEIVKTVQLGAMQKCMVVNTLKSQNGNTKGGSGQGKLALSLLPVKKDSREILLEFYNENDRVQLSDELILINKWNEIISQKLRK
ncbi:MAG: hypothetical protein AB7S72_19235 [Draconibacterium sp.]